MTHRNVVCTCLVMLLISSLSVPVRADERYTVSEHAEPPKPQADKALVYFVVEPGGSFWTPKLYVDKHPVGFLPNGSYTATLVEPGIRLIWGLQWGQWLEFKAGKRYLLQTTAGSQEWLLRHPTGIVAVEKSEKLKYVGVTEVGLRKLRRNLDAKYEEARQDAGDPTPVTLPISFQVQVQVSKPGSEEQRASGTLTIEETGIRFASKKLSFPDKLSFDIPIEDVDRVDLSSVLTSYGSVMTSFSVLSTKSHGFIRIGGSLESSRDYNRRFQAIMKALESCASCSAVPAKGKGSGPRPPKRASELTQREQRQEINALADCQAQIPGVKINWDTLTGYYIFEGENSEKYKECLKTKHGWFELGPPEWAKDTMAPPR